MDCYVYVHLDPVDEMPLYIGKGRNGRDRQHLSASYRKAVKGRYPRYYRKLDKMQAAGSEPIVHRLLEGLDDETAYRWQRFFIQALGRRGDKRNPGPLYNLRDGGQGATQRGAQERWGWSDDAKRQRRIDEAARIAREGHKTRGPRKGHRYRGVERRGNRYRGRVGLLGCGSHTSSRWVATEEEAARLYDALALEYLGPDTHLNFPETAPCAT